VLLNKRILFFGGKGGVGKTTCASAVALAASRSGKRVLLVSTDPAHSTSDIFEKQFGRTESEICPGLFGIELDGEFEARAYIDAVKRQISTMFSSSILKEAERQIELASMMPGVEDVALFDRMSDLIVSRSDDYELIVFDTAPTGHSLRLLRMPELMTSWIAALSARRRSLVSLDRNIDRVRLKPNDSGSVEDDPILKALERRGEKLEQVRSRLLHHNDTGFVLVLIPEKLPIEESVRAAKLLLDANVNVCSVIVNRVLPDAADGEFYLSRRRQEQIYRDEIVRRLGSYPLQWVPQFETDVYGMANLIRLSAVLVNEPT
jgi:arsenite/tail-anchored protein-transporting ATPase